MRERIPVVVQRRRGQRQLVARVLWTGAELAVTLGVVVLLLVVHQLYWTNRQAQQGARRQVAALERQWEAGPKPSYEPLPTPTMAERHTSALDRGTTPGGPPRRAGQEAYAVLRIARIGITVPVAEGVSRSGVLNKGYAGHYPHTARPGGAGNFALAGHRNTHGEPFRFINRLRPGDEIRVDTAQARYTYTVRRTLPQTTPSDGTVLAPTPYSSVHPSFRFTAPGQYLTLTTCTPEYTSAYRLVVWGELTAAGPR